MVAGGILATLGFILLFCTLVPHIIVIVKIFKHAGVGLGILSIFCGPFAFIWGWIKSKELGLKKVMLAYTILLILGVVLYGAGGAAMVTSPEMQKAIQDAKVQQEQRDAAPAPAPQN
jgi:hypothetical protein